MNAPRNTKIKQMAITQGTMKIHVMRQATSALTESPPSGPLTSPSKPEVSSPSGRVYSQARLRPSSRAKNGVERRNPHFKPFGESNEQYSCQNGPSGVAALLATYCACPRATLSSSEHHQITLRGKCFAS